MQEDIELISHIRFTCDENKSWCGEPLGQGFYFKDAEQAAISGATEGKRKACEPCVQKIIVCLQNEWER